MASKARNLSALVDKQLPSFISSEYPKFSAFLKKYYEQLELPGQPIDLISNLTKYRDVDTYEKNLLKENTKLSQNLSASSTTINVESTKGFPKENGYILIEDEAIFYKSKTETSFVDCFRNISATTKLGDLYNKSDIKTVPYAELGEGVSHLSGRTVTNISNLFLYALVKNFETEYLGSFPENSLKEEVDKSLLIKNIKKFYSAKGTDQSIRFIFNSIVTKDPTNIPTVYYPKDSTYKVSSGEWIDKYSLKVKVVSGDISKIIGEKIIQDENPLDLSVKPAFAFVDNILDIGDNFYEVILSESSVVGQFSIATETFLTKTLLASDSANKKINVYSTLGWNSTSGQVLIGNETITYKSKNVNQFVIESRGSLPQTYTVNQPVYNYSNVYADYVDNSGNKQRVKFIILGILYNFKNTDSKPYSKIGDTIQSFSSGFETKNTIIFDKFSNSTRWEINESNTAPNSDNLSLKNSLSDVISDVSAVFEDSEYYYIASSGFPSHKIGKESWNVEFKDQKKLKLIRKSPSRTTEIYETPSNEVGILVNGATVRSYKDSKDNLIVFGEITNITLTNGGSGYKKPPYVLVQDGSGSIVAKAKAFLNGEVVDRIEVEESGSGFFPPVPAVTITSGRGAVVSPVVTGDSITSLTIINPGEYYSSPPKVIIRDSSGQGRSARFEALISDEGKLIGFKKFEEGKFYSQNTTTVEIVPEGRGATATSIVRTWRRNLFNKHFSQLDDNNGYYFQNNNISLGYGYSYLANPKSLRVSLGDNLDSLGNIPSTLSHSPILGYAFDGNPIYGPYGYSVATDSNSSVTRMISSYRLKISRPGGPALSQYPLGSFEEDFEYVHRSGSLDENNGRYCVTPDYPEGVYAYFVTIDDDNTPVFPYILGKNFYSLPVDSNYDKVISQDDIPTQITRLKTDRTPNDGDDVFGYVNDVSSGSISSAIVEYSPASFSVGNIVEVNYGDTNGKDLIAQVSSVKGKTVTGIDSQERKAVKITTENPAYFFADSVITQRNTNASGKTLGNVFDDKTIVLYDVNGNFNTTDVIYSSITVYNLLLSEASDYTEGEQLSLTNGKQSIILRSENNSLVVAQNLFENGEPIVFSNTFSGITRDTIYYVVNSGPTSFKVSTTPNGAAISIANNNSPGAVATSRKGLGLILESTTGRNTVKVRLLQGTFTNDSDYYLRSTSINDSIGSVITNVFVLSDQIKPILINDKIAIATTSQDHGVGVGDSVDIQIDPDDEETETTIFTRSRIYQKVKLNAQIYTKYINDTGIGRLVTLNNGSYRQNNQIVGDYASSTSGNATFTNVELIFADVSKCRDAEGRIVGNSNLSAIGRAGNPNNARANVTVTNGVVTNVVITAKGTGYKRGDILTISADDLDRNSNSTSTRFYTAEVQHVGFAEAQTRLYLNDVSFISQNDYIKIDQEIIKVTSINIRNSYIDVIRGQFNTTPVDHFNNQEVNSYQERYNLPAGFRIGNSDTDPFVLSYNPETQELTLVFDTSNIISSINTLSSGSAFFDNSVPKKLVTVKDNIESPNYKFEFSYDNNTWLTNPELKLQKFYKYKFDTSHFTLRNSFLEFSPSGNYNIITTETVRNNILPGSSGSYITLKVGYGPEISTNDYTVRDETNFSTYFYFDKNSRINSDRSFARIIDDPLQGRKQVTYVTPRSFVYEMDTYPEYDGSGSIKYSTTSNTAVGEIKEIDIINQGSSFEDLPTVYGVRPTEENECVADVIWNSTAKNISSVVISNPGKNYSKPKAILLNATGSFASFDVIKDENGSIKGIITTNKGENYTTKPEIKIVESDVKIYFDSRNIGVSRSVEVVFNGKNFGNDLSIRKKYYTTRILKLKNISSSKFIDGERVEQYDGSTLIASGVVATNGFKDGTNIIRLNNVEGEFKNGLQVRGTINNSTATVSSNFASLYDGDIRSYYDNLGYYASDRGKISSNYQKLADSYFYQDYSYVIKSKTPIDVWRDLINQTVHPAGFKLFGEVSVESSATNRVPSTQPSSSKVSIVQLWDPDKNKITVENTYRKVTQSTFRVYDSNVVRGKGSVFSPAYDTGETVSYDFKLVPDFNGYFDANGNLAGNTTFTAVLIGSNTPYSIVNQNNVFITIDGILQEPGKAFNIVAGQIVFNKPPLGYRSVFGDPITQSEYKEGVDTPSQKAVCRIVRFKDNNLNNQYFRKLKDISQEFDGSQTAFDLYYEDDTPVSLSYNENLIVSIDGVVQQAGVSPLLPLDRAYYIRRTVTPNQIVFVEPPRKFEQIRQSFFAYSVGAYERLRLDERYVNDIRRGPFLLRSSVTGKTVIVDNDTNVLVFADGVLQKRNKTYIIRGANITFIEPIKKGQKINVIYLYGRDFIKSLTAFNYETTPYYNRYNIVLSGHHPHISSDCRISSESAKGIVLKTFYNGLNTTVTVDSYNARFVLGESIDVSHSSDSFYDYTISSDDIISISEFTENDDRQDILSKSSIGWLTGTSRNVNYDFIEVGDLIKIDGETSFRKVLSTPKDAVKTDYRVQDNLSYFSKIATTNYDGISRGEGLDIVAEIENGRVVSLLWNKTEWGDYVTQKILPSPPGYGYETAPQLVFVSQPLKDEGGTIISPAQGGGAKAYAVVSNGEIVDIVLYDQGSGYTTPPRVYVTRNYDILRKGRNIETSLVSLTMSPNIVDAKTLYITSGDIVGNPTPPILFISSVVALTPLDISRKIAAIIQREVNVSQSSTRVIQHVSEINLGINVSLISSRLEVYTSSIETPLSIASQNKVSINQTEREIKTDIRTFAKVNYLLAYKSLHATGAYLDAPMDLDDTIAYVTTTEKFKSFGKLLIGDEIVSYTLKLSDRFVNIERGIDGSTVKNHPAGQFLRQYGEDVSLISAGVQSAAIVSVEVTGGGVTSTSVGITDILEIEVDNSSIIVEKELLKGFETVNVIDSISDNTGLQPTTFILNIGVNVGLSENNVIKQFETITSTGIENISTNTVQNIVYSVERLYKTGIIDYYTESVLFTDPVRQRNGNLVSLESPKIDIYQRSGDIVLVKNAESNDENLESYTIGNLGNRLNLLNNWYSINTGVNSALTFNEIEINYNEFVIRDFDERGFSSISFSRNIWNLAYPSIQNPVTISSTQGTISSSIVVLNTTYFADSGYIYHTDGNSTFGVIRYTGKTSSSFTGCTVYSGSSTITNTSQIIPYSV